jgi:parvulin-like peptidyl-prolyl isomerase
MRPLAVLGLSLALLLPAWAQNGTPRKPVKKPAALRRPGPDVPSKAAPGASFCVVNGEAVPLSVYMDRLSLRYAPEMRETLIEEMLVRQEAKRRKLTATPAEIEKTVARAYGESVRRYGEEKLLVEDLKNTRGWTPEDFKAVIRDQADVQVLRAKIAESLAGPDSVTDEQVKTRYESQKQAFTQPDTVRISHIMVRRPSDAAQEPAARKKAEGLLKQVQDARGANFEQVARESSDDDATKAKGGKIPVEIARGANPYGAAFEAAVFSAPVGIVDEVIATPLGFHVVRVEEKRPGRLLPLSEVREQIRAALLMQRQQQALDELFVRLRTSAKIDTGRY